MCSFASGWPRPARLRTRFRLGPAGSEAGGGGQDKVDASESAPRTSEKIQR